MPPSATLLAKHPEAIPVDADESVEAQGRHDEEQGNAEGKTGLATPPLDMDIEQSKVSRKREREVSLEPSTPQAVSVDIDAPSSAQRDKDRRTPAKKNRTSAQLDTTAEQDEDSQDVVVVDESDPVSRSSPPSGPASSRTPPLENGEPPTALAAEDLNWKSLGGVSAKLAFESQQESADESAEMDHEDESHLPASDKPSDSPTATADSGHAVRGSQQPEAPGPAEAPAPSERAQNRSPVPFPVSSAGPSGPSPPPSPPTSSSPRVPPLLPSALEDDVKSGQKRKLGDRSVSERHIPGDIGERKGKRASPPPPVEETEEPAENAEVAKPKASGFMAYASSNSPFATVRGPNVFATKPFSQSSSAPSSSPLGSSTTPPASSSPFSFTPSATPSKEPPKSATSTPPATSPVLSTPQPFAPQKRTGFEAFASTSSPFASAAKRPKSPPPAFASTSNHGHTGVGLGFGGFGHLGKNMKRPGSPARTSVFGSNAGSSSTASAFSAYASAGSPFRSAFSIPSTSTSSSASSVLGSALDPPARESSPLNGAARSSALSDAGEDRDSEAGDNDQANVTFGERLRASKDAEEEDGDEAANGTKVELTEQEVMTGEEDEETVFQVRGKLFSLSEQNQWRERGTGNLKLNVRRLDSGGARLVMRKEAVYTLLLNAPLFKGMRCFLAQDPRYLRFSVLEAGSATHYNLRVTNAKIAEELLTEINAHIPTD